MTAKTDVNRADDETSMPDETEMTISKLSPICAVSPSFKQLM